MTIKGNKLKNCSKGIYIMPNVAQIENCVFYHGKSMIERFMELDKAFDILIGLQIANIILIGIQVSCIVLRWLGF